MRNNAALRRRIAEAETAVNERFTQHAMGVFADAMAAQPPHVRMRVEQRLRQLAASKSSDPAWSGDPAVSILRAVHQVAPDIALHVAARLRIELPQGN